MSKNLKIQVALRLYHLEIVITYQNKLENLEKEVFCLRNFKGSKHISESDRK